MRPLVDERKENCAMREAVENGFLCEGRVITGLKAGVNESAPPLCIARAQPLEGEARDFARILQVKFVFDVRPMGFHCLGAEMQ